MPSINFKGKNVIWNHHLSVPYQILEKNKKLSVKGKNENENLIIEGDNLIALKSLLPQYQGRIKCIYIDPPYNIGNENWIYNDNVNSPLIKDWIGETVNADDLTRHDKWLCMMTPRLKLLQELLSDDGVIFISIDDNEIQHLKTLLNEIFDKKNFIGQIVVKSNPRGSQEPFGISAEHEYVLCYSKTEFGRNSIVGYERSKDDKEFIYIDKNNRKGRLLGLRKRGGDWRKEHRPNMFYPFYVNPKTLAVSLKKKKGFTKKILPIRPDKEKSRWTWGLKTAEIRINELVVKKIRRDGKIVYDIYRIDYLEGNEGERKREKLKSLFLDKEFNYQHARQYLKDLFGNSELFDFPKPPELIKKFLCAFKEKNYFVLDSFAGSGTTAHAVLDLNKEDGGNRKFILVQLPEKIQKGTIAHKAGFRYIHEITRERAKRAIKKYYFNNGFSYMRLGPKIDADSILGGQLPNYKELAKYVYYLATGKTMVNGKSIKEKDYFVGKNGRESIYLIYENKKDKLRNLAITLEWAEKINKKDKSKKIVYAPACFLNEEDLERLNIDFVGIPYSLFGKK